MLSKESLAYFDWYMADYNPAKEVEDYLKTLIEFLIDTLNNVFKEERMKSIIAKVKTKDDWYEVISVAIRELEKTLPEKYKIHIDSKLEILFLHIIYTELVKKES